MKSLKTIATKIWPLLTLLLILFNTSCEYSSPAKDFELSEITVDEQRLIDEISLTKSKRRTSVVLDDPCVISFNPQNCIEFNFELEYPINISGCATGTTAICNVYAEMHLTICEYAHNVEVNLVETVWGHDQNCIIDQNNHVDDLECIMEIAYATYISTIMPYLLNIYNEYSSCESGLNTFVSKYHREICYYPCAEQSGGFYNVRFLPCGSNTVCCVQETQWCKDSLGIIQTISEPSIQIGECSPGNLPCRNSTGPLYPQWESCRTRNCLPPVID